MSLVFENQRKINLNQSHVVIRDVEVPLTI